MAKSTFPASSLSTNRTALVALALLVSVSLSSVSGSFLPAEEMLEETVRGGETEELIRNYKLGQDRQVKPPPTPWV